MTIPLEPANFIVPISVIERKYPGGWQQCQKDHNSESGFPFPAWYDDQLFRIGGKSIYLLKIVFSHWPSIGFRIKRKVKGQAVWHQGCFIRGGESTPTLPCPWLMVADDGMSAWMKPGHPYETERA
jgi:hypothetical protein